MNESFGELSKLLFDFSFSAISTQINQRLIHFSAEQFGFESVFFCISHIIREYYSFSINVNRNYMRCEMICLAIL